MTYFFSSILFHSCSYLSRCPIEYHRGSSEICSGRLALEVPFIAFGVIHRVSSSSFSDFDFQSSFQSVFPKVTADTFRNSWPLVSIVSAFWVHGRTGPGLTLLAILWVFRFWVWDQALIGSEPSYPLSFGPFSAALSFFQPKKPSSNQFAV